MGFDRYLTEQPTKEAAPALDRELKAVDFVINELLDSGVQSIASTSLINRAPLPEESKRQARSKDLVTKSVLEISFVADQNNVPQGAERSDPDKTAVLHCSHGSNQKPERKGRHQETWPQKQDTKTTKTGMKNLVVGSRESAGLFEAGYC